MAVLVANKVTKRFGGLQAVGNLDIEVKENAIQSIIGPNGAGKTTFFNCVTGFYTPEEGEILLEGKNITGLSPDRVTRRGIARTYQNIRLFKNMTTVENILVGMHPHLGTDRRHPERSTHQPRGRSGICRSHEIASIRWPERAR
jgi:branched-chain amino acid transport system ATP-binding protein